MRPTDSNCGMFVPVVIYLKKHEKFTGDNYHELMDLFYTKSVQSGVLVVLGRNMSSDKKLSAPRSNFIRTTICFVDIHDILKEAVSRLNEATIIFLRTNKPFM